MPARTTAESAGLLAAPKGVTPRVTGRLDRDPRRVVALSGPLEEVGEHLDLDLVVRLAVLQLAAEYGRLHARGARGRCLARSLRPERTRDHADPRQHLPTQAPTMTRNPWKPRKMASKRSLTLWRPSDSSMIPERNIRTNM